MLLSLSDDSWFLILHNLDCIFCWFSEAIFTTRFLLGNTIETKVDQAMVDLKLEEYNLICFSWNIRIFSVEVCVFLWLFHKYDIVVL